MNAPQILTGGLAAAATISVAVIAGLFANCTANLESDIERLNAEITRAELDLDQNRFKAEQQARKDALLKEYVPRLTSSIEAERNEALMIIFLLFPNDATAILTDARAALSPERAALFVTDAVLEEAEAIAEATGSWAIVVGSDASLEGAQQEAAGTADSGYTPVTIYQQGDELFATAITALPNEVQAETVLFDVRAQVRESAFVVNLNEWCPGAAERDGFIECVVE